MKIRTWITCPICGWTSYHPQDVEHRFCAHCDRYHDDMTSEEIGLATSQRRRFDEFRKTRLGGWICRHFNLYP